jgi:hypothetical protein
MALFEKFYEDRKDPCEVIALFLGSYLKQTGLLRFNLVQITNEMNNYYNFNLPLAIVELGISKLGFIQKTEDKTEFRVSNSDLQKDERFLVDEDVFCGDKVLEKLFSYIENKQGDKISSLEKSNILNSFCDFLLDKHSCMDYYELISEFVLKNDDEMTQKQLESIADGMIIYKGITTDIDISEKKQFQQPLVLYLDTEILFHLAGYNGIFYKQQFDEFFKLIQEVNKKEQIISFRYFKSVDQEINNFFTSAAEIVEKKAILYETTAMTSIIKGCKKARDVFMKQRAFERLLNEKQISFDPKEYLNDETESKYKLDEEIDSQLSCINILRKGLNKKNYTNIKFILISGKNQLLNFLPESATDDVRHFAISLGHITKIIWFAQNKGFGVSNRILSFDVVKRAKMVMSSIVTKGLKQRFEEARVKFENKELTIDDMAKIVLDFRKIPNLPEYIEKDNFESVLRISCEDAFNRIQNENYLREAENNSLKNELKEKISSLDEEKRKRQDISINLTRVQEDHLENIDLSINRLKIAKEKADKKINLSVRKLKVFSSLICIILYAIVVVIVVKNDWDHLEPKTYLIGLIPALFIFIFSYIWGKTINPRKIEQIYREKKAQYFYNEYGFDYHLMEELLYKRDLLMQKIKK